MARFGMISELEMARLVAISRLVMGDVPKAHCTHEPHAASLMAGANLFFPEVGSSPRDGCPDTRQGKRQGCTAVSGHSSGDDVGSGIAFECLLKCALYLYDKRLLF